MTAPWNNANLTAGRDKEALARLPEDESLRGGLPPKDNRSRTDRKGSVQVVVEEPADTLQEESSPVLPGRSSMKRCALLVVTAVLLVAAEEAKDDASSKDLKKLTGTWTLASGVNDGEKMSEKELEGSKLVIDGDKHDVKVGETTYKGTHKLDASKKPKTIDIMDTEGPFKDKTVLGIYKFDGKQFTICFAASGKDRPKGFSAKAGSGQHLHVWKRMKK
jgi:uncharacterized protein (TIGR03067 family)